MGYVDLAEYDSPVETVIVSVKNDTVYLQHNVKGGQSIPDRTLSTAAAIKLLRSWCEKYPVDGSHARSQLLIDGVFWLNEQGVPTPRSAAVPCPKAPRTRGGPTPVVLGVCSDPGTTMHVVQVGAMYLLITETVGHGGKYVYGTKRDEIAKAAALDWLRQFRAHGHRKGSAQTCSLTDAGNALLRENPKMPRSKRCCR
jgi:hypothetical protein